MSMNKAATKSIPSHHQIEVRQRTEEVIDTYAKHVGLDKKLEFIGKWEQKSTKRVTATQITQEMDRIEALYNEVLMERKRRLAHLLATERDELEAELVSSTETKSQRRDRIATEALQLRNEREMIRKKVADELKERCFVNACVPLREASSKLMLLKCVSERGLQIEEQKRRQQAINDETQFFYMLQSQTQKQAEDKQRMELENRRQKTESLKHDLAVQRMANQTMHDRARHLKALEDEAFSEQLKQTQAEDAKKDAARRQNQREMVTRNKAFNKEQQVEKETLTEKKRAEDKAELQALMDKIKEDEQAELENKRKSKEEALARRREQELALRKFADDESHMDALWVQESEKAWNKLETRRKAEQDAREALHQEVHQGRLEQIRTKRAQRLAEKDAKFAQRAEFQKDREILKEQQAAEAQAARSNAVRNQMQLRAQIAQVEEARHQARERKLEEVAAGVVAEEQFARSMQKEMEKLENAKPPEFVNVQVKGPVSRRFV